MKEALERIEMKVEVLDDDRLQVIPPTFRPDITREVDLTEEIARIVGYDRVPVTSPEAKVESSTLDPHFDKRRQVRDLLKGAGFFEVLTYSFISLNSLGKLRLPAGDPRLQPIHLKNPLSEEQAVMRTSLVPGVLQTALHNFDRLNEDLRIYELSKVFLPREGEALPAERHHLAGVAAGRRSPHILYGSEEEIDYTDVKGAVEIILDLFNLDGLRYASEELPPYFDPSCAASVFCRERRVGSLGRLHPEVVDAFDFKKPIYLFELDFDEVYAMKNPHPAFRSLPRFPAVVRDMALVVDESLEVREPFAFILSQGEALLERLEVFDIYRNPQLGTGMKSIGYRLVYRSADRSLTDEEVNAIHDGLVGKVLNAFHATLR
jgi:phenylalanyl-tRNA synthetase beta chain